MNEIWKQIPANPKYEASSYGRIRSSRRVLKTANKITGAGYESASLGRSVCGSVHRFVWSAFNGEIPKGMTINHIDGNKRNNSLSNLEVCSHAENNRHAWRTGLNESVRKSASKRMRGFGNLKNILTKAQASEIVRRNLAGESQESLAKEFGISQGAVSYAKVTRWYER